jgi:hypothetical protein
MTEVWFTSDLMLDTPERAEYVVGQFNERVEPNDLVWILGNIVHTVEMLPYLDRMFGRKIVLPGELELAHGEDAWPGLFPGARTVNGKSRQPLTIHVGGGLGPILLSSFPYVLASRVSDFSADRFRGWRPRPAASRKWLVRGSEGEIFDLERREVGVGFDAHGGAPVHIESVRQSIRLGASLRQ